MNFLQRGLSAIASCQCLNILRIRDANLAKRGIDPSSADEQLAAVEEQGRRLMEKVKEELKERREAARKEGNYQGGTQEVRMDD